MLFRWSDDIWRLPVEGVQVFNSARCRRVFALSAKGVIVSGNGCLPVKSRRMQVGPWVVFGVALLLHLLLIADGPRDPTWRRPIVDAATYHGLARQLLAGTYHANTPFYQPPGFAAFLAGIYGVTGSDMAAARWGLALMGALTALFAFRIGRKLFGDRTGLLAGLLTALHGPLLFFNLQLLPAGLATLLNTVLLWLLLDLADHDRWSGWLWAGGCAGLAAVTVPNVLLFLPVAGLWLWSVRIPLAVRDGPFSRLWLRGLRQAAARCALMALGTCLAIAPVTLHNKLASGRFALISHNGGLNFYIGNNPDSDATTAIRPGFDWERLDKMPMRAGVLHAVDADRFYYQQALAYIRARPGHFLRQLGRKLRQVSHARELPRNVDVYAFRGYYRGLRPLVWRLGTFAFPAGLYVPLACGGMLLALRRRDPRCLLPAWFVLVYGLSVALFFVAARYRLVMVPALSLYAAAVLDRRVWQQAFPAGGSRAHGLVGVALVVLVAGLWANTPLRAPTDDIPFRAEMYNFVALQRVAVGDYTGAERLFERSLTVAPDFAPTYQGLGFLHSRRGDPAAARDAYREAIRHDNRYAEAFNGLGQVLEQLGEADAAERAYRRAIALSPETAILWSNLGHRLHARGQRAEAVATLRRAIALDITVEPAYGLLAWILSTAPEPALRDGEQALALIRFLIRWRGDRDPMRMDTLAAAYAETGRFPEAVQAATTALARWRAIGRDDVARQAEARLARYRLGAPVREDESVGVP